MTSNIIKSFSDKAYSYDSQSFVQKDVNKRLLSRLDLILSLIHISEPTRPY